MVSTSRFISGLAGGCLLGLGLSIATQAAETPPAAERMNPDASADRKADLEKPDEDTLQGINTLKGEVLRIKGEHIYVRRSDGKKVHLHTKPTTQMTGKFMKGDRIEAKVNDQNDVVSIHQAK
jgi:hypothetical protein